MLWHVVAAVTAAATVAVVEVEYSQGLLYTLPETTMTILDLSAAPFAHSMSFTNPATVEDYLEPAPSKIESYASTTATDLKGSLPPMPPEEEYAEIPSNLRRQPVSEPALVQV